MTGDLAVSITQYPAGGPGSGPYGLTAGPDDAVWFTQVHRGRVGTDAACWFTEWASGRISRIAPDGNIETHPLPDPASEPHGITVGPDGTLWAALETGSIAHLTPAPPR